LFLGFGRVLSTCGDAFPGRQSFAPFFRRLRLVRKILDQLALFLLIQFRFLGRERRRRDTSRLSWYLIIHK